MLKIRFLRTGRKKQPSFKIVVVQKTASSTSGKFIEQLGFYNPITKEKEIQKERAEYWLSKGAKPSDTVHNLFVKEGVIKGEKIPVHKKKKRGAENSSGQGQQGQDKAKEQKTEESLENAPEESKEDKREEPTQKEGAVATEEGERRQEK